MENISDSEDYINLNIKTNEYPLNMETAKRLLVSFAKLHVKAALDAADKEANYCIDNYGGLFPKNIINAYPESNIK